MEHLSFTFKDYPPHDTIVIRLGEPGTALTDAFKREIGCRILSATKFLFAVILENDNGTFLVFVPYKKDANLCNARSSMKTLLLRQTGLDPALALAMQYVDFNTLIEFGLFRRNDVKEYFVKKQDDLPLIIENTNFQATERCANRI